MKKGELKKVLKPIIKECIKESLYEEGLLKNIVSQVVEGYSTGKAAIVETKPVTTSASRGKDEESAKMRLQLESTRKKLIDAVGSNSYGGVNVFEGTTPAPSEGTSHGNVMEGVDPSDPGVDISKIFNQNWGKLI